MALAVQIKFVQGLTVGQPGQAVIGVDGVVVTATAIVTGGTLGLQYRWTWIDTPPTSVITVGEIVEGNVPAITFTPDIHGDFLLQLELFGPQGTAVRTATVFRVPRTSGRAIPAFTADAASLNFSGQKRGWAPDMEVWLAFLDGLSAGVNFVEIALASDVITANGVYTRAGARMIDLSLFSHISTAKFYVAIENSQDSNTWYTRARLFDLTHNIEVTGSALDNSATSPGKDLTQELSATLTVGSAAGNLRNDVPTLYAVQVETVGSISDPNAQRAIISNARILINI